MKKILLLTALFLSTHLGTQLFAQTFKFHQTENIHNQLRLNTKTGEVYQIQDNGLKFLVHAPPTPKSQNKRYSLHKTKNMWTYILLDDFTGKLWQCQYSIKGPEYRSSWEINPIAISTTEKSKFTIQPLTSMFQFYLINDENGEMWKFQWSTKGESFRWIEKF